MLTGQAEQEVDQSSSRVAGPGFSSKCAQRASNIAGVMLRFRLRRFDRLEGRHNIVCLSVFCARREHYIQC